MVYYLCNFYVNLKPEFYYPHFIRTYLLPSSSLLPLKPRPPCLNWWSQTIFPIAGGQSLPPFPFGHGADKAPPVMLTPHACHSAPTTPSFKISYLGATSVAEASALIVLVLQAELGSKAFDRCFNKHFFQSSQFCMIGLTVSFQWIKKLKLREMMYHIARQGHIASRQQS